MSEVSGPTEQPEDPWSDQPVLPSPGADPRPAPEEVMALWGWQLRREHRSECYRPNDPLRLARRFWERLQSCAPLRDLCDRHQAEQAELLHRVVSLLRDIHDHPELRVPTGQGVPAAEVKRHKQAATRKLKGLRRVREIVTELIPDEGERNLILSFLTSREAAAAEQLRNPRIQIRLFTTMKKGQDLLEHQEVSEIPILPRRSGRPVEEADTFNAKVALLRESVRTLVGEGSYWPVVAALLSHFCHNVFSLSSDPLEREREIDRIQKRVDSVRPEILEEQRAILDRQVAWLLKPRPPSRS